MNESAGGVEARVSVSRTSAGGRAAAFRLSQANPDGIARLDDVTVSGGSFTISLPASSATLLVLGGR